MYVTWVAPVVSLIVLIFALAAPVPCGVPFVVSAGQSARQLALHDDIVDESEVNKYTARPLLSVRYVPIGPLWVSTVVPVEDPPVGADFDGAELDGAELDEDAELGGADDEPPDPEALLPELPQAARTTAAAANGKPILPT